MPGMEALRFQYTNIARFAQKARNRWKLAEHHQRTMEKSYSAERRQREQLQQEIDELKSKVANLEQAASKLRKWEARKPLINHYLAVIQPMSDEIRSMRGKLHELGYIVSNRSYAYDSGAQANGETSDRSREHQQVHGGAGRIAGAVQDHSSSARKRKLAEISQQQYHQISQRGQQHRTSSKELMPPPIPRPPPADTRKGEARQEYRAQFPCVVEEYDSSEWIAPKDGTSKLLSGVSQPLPFRPPPSQSAAHGDPPRFQRDSRHNAPHLKYGTQAAEDDRSHEPTFTSNESFQQLYGRRDERKSHGTRRGHPHIKHYDADYGALSNQQDIIDRQEIRVPPSSHAYRMPPSQPSYKTPSPQRHAINERTSAASPFIRRAALTGVASPLTRGSTERPLYRSPDQINGAPYGADTAYSSAAPRKPSRPLLNGLSFIDQPYHSTQHQRLLPSSRMGPPPTFGIPRGPVRHFERLPVPASASYSKLQPSAYNGRISLPPAGRSPNRYLGSQEQTLTRIPGVRGVSSQGARPSKYQHGPLYQPGRALFSSVGGRRSVRR